MLSQLIPSRMSSPRSKTRKLFHQISTFQWWFKESHSNSLQLQLETHTTQMVHQALPPLSTRDSHMMTGTETACKYSWQYFTGLKTHADYSLAAFCPSSLPIPRLRSNLSFWIEHEAKNSRIVPLWRINRQTRIPELSPKKARIPRKFQNCPLVKNRSPDTYSRVVPKKSKNSA